MRQVAIRPNAAVAFLLGLLLFASTALTSAAPVMVAPPARLEYEVVRVLPHDPESFTQGLIVENGSMVETSGLYGRSYIHRYDKNTGARLQLKRLPTSIFAEGVTSYNGRLYLLTWKAGVLLVLDGSTLELVDRRQYSGEGWGITHNSTHFIVSDGSDRLQFRDLKTFSRTRDVRVADPTHSWRNLNELEYAQGRVWANVWQVPKILAISPDNGRVEGVLDLTALAEANNSHPGESVLNGIAYDAAEGTFWVTGKLWPKRYEIRVALPGNPPGKRESKTIAPAVDRSADAESIHRDKNESNAD